MAVIILFLFLTELWVDLWFVIIEFSDQTH